MEPNMHQIDDYNNQESVNKRFIVNMVVVGLLGLSVILGMVKYHFDHHTPESFNPIIHR